jgi:outer membrane lipoprotein LolB
LKALRRFAFRAAAALWPAALASAVLIAGCAGLPAAGPAGDAVVGAHSYVGRFSLVVTRTEPGMDEQRSAWSGRFSLAVAGAQSLTLDLVSPMGATIARIETDSREARLLVPADGGVRVEHGADAQALAEQVLGWSLPIAGLPDWIQGRPAADRGYRALAPEPGKDRFEQDGWDVTVERPGGDRPGLRVQMDRAARDRSPAVALRVVLDGPAS